MDSLIETAPTYTDDGKHSFWIYNTIARQIENIWFDKLKEFVIEIPTSSWISISRDNIVPFRPAQQLPANALEQT